MADHEVSADQPFHEGEIPTRHNPKGDVFDYFDLASFGDLQAQAQTQLQPPEIDFDPQGIFESRLDFAFELSLLEAPPIDPASTAHTPTTAIISNVVPPNHDATALQMTLIPATPQTSQAITAAPPQQSFGTTEMVLNIEQPFTTKCYTNRKFPSFGVRLTSNYQAVAGCYIALITLHCGSPNNPPPPNPPAPNSHTILHDSRKQHFGVAAFEYPLVNGHGTVDWLKFLKVSSKHGGGFYLRVTLRDKPEVFALSNKIVVKSSRTIHTQKTGFMSRVQSQSPVSAIPNIGKRYSERLMTIGVQTAAHLAWLHSDKEMQRKVFQSIYKIRGTLTETTFGAICAQLGERVEVEEPCLELSHSL